MARKSRFGGRRRTRPPDTEDLEVRAFSPPLLSGDSPRQGLAQADFLVGMMNDGREFAARSPDLIAAPGTAPPGRTQHALMMVDASRVDQILRDSLSLLPEGRLSDEAVTRLNTILEDEFDLMWLGFQNHHPTNDGWEVLFTGTRGSTRRPSSESSPRTVASVGPSHEGGYTVYALWMMMQHAGGIAALTRLKICPQCNKWFVDKTHNRMAVRCSIQCTNRWWNKERRRRANHRAKSKRTPGRAR